MNPQRCVLSQTPSVTMRIALALVVLVATGFVSSSSAGEQELLDKFKRQNAATRDKLVADIKQVLDQAKALEKDEPAAALGLLQDTRDRMLQKGLLAASVRRILAGESLLDLSSLFVRF